MNKFFGIALVVVGLAIAIVPNFMDCASQGKYMNVMGAQIPMACHWAARGEMALGIPLAVVGGVFSFTQRKSGFLTLSIIGLVLGSLAVILPGHIINTCASPTMECNTTMRPTISVLGSLAMVGSLGGLVLMRKSNS